MRSGGSRTTPPPPPPQHCTPGVLHSPPRPLWNTPPSPTTLHTGCTAVPLSLYGTPPLPHSTAQSIRRSQNPTSWPSPFPPPPPPAVGCLPTAIIYRPAAVSQPPSPWANPQLPSVPCNRCHLASNRCWYPSNRCRLPLLSNSSCSKLSLLTCLDNATYILRPSKWLSTL